MHPTHAVLHERLRDFPFDDGQPALPFETRLAHENGWSADFARRVVAEYKRFLFLAATADEPVTPSEHVDQAWHLHLTYTRSYWDRLCRDVLGRPLHHDPTRGGPAEGARHHRQYQRTLAAYRVTFREAPPADIWPPAAARFGADARAVRVNTAGNWVVQKAAVRRGAGGLAAALALVAVAGCGAPEGIGPSGVVVLAALGLVGLGVGLVWAIWKYGEVGTGRKHGGGTGCATSTGGCGGGGCGTAGGCGGGCGGGGCGGGGCGGCGGGS